jgi:hypothetical protein
MGYIAPAPAFVKPLAVYAYFDQIAVTFHQHVTDWQLIEWMQSQCGYGPMQGQRDRIDYGEPGQPLYLKRFQYRQPQRPLLEWLAVNKQRIEKSNYAEIALDLIFKLEDFEAACAFADYHNIQKWHRKQRIAVHHGSRYSGSRKKRARNIIDMYRDTCRVTGETCCLHLEWRVAGLAAMHSANIHVEDYPDYNHNAFWKKRLLFVTVTPEELGRYIRNSGRGKGRKSKTPLIDSWQFANKTYNTNMDARLGEILFELVYLTLEDKEAENPPFSNVQYRMQDLLDKHAKDFQLRIGQPIRLIDNTDWLPSRSYHPGADRMVENATDSNGVEGRGNYKAVLCHESHNKVWVEDGH